MEDCGALQLPSSTTDPTKNVLQWILESKRQSRHKSHRWARLGSARLDSDCPGVCPCSPDLMQLV